MSRTDALAAAETAGLDLVEISPAASPPVAKIIDWGKYQYQKMKELQRNKKNAKQSELKQMRLGLKIVFRGREMAHLELGYERINRIIELLEDDAVVEQKPQMAGRNLSITVRSK